jgi:hypothetical protein
VRANSARFRTCLRNCEWPVEDLMRQGETRAVQSAKAVSKGLARELGIEEELSHAAAL